MVSRRSQRRAKALATPTPVDLLSDELILMVFEIIHTTDRASPFAATRVCSKWHILAQRTIDASVEPLVLWPRSAASNMKLFHHLKRDAEFRRTVNHLSVRDWYLDDMALYGRGYYERSPLAVGEYFSATWNETQRHKDPTRPQIQAFADAVSCMSLVCFTWSAALSLPEELSLALRRMPRCKVYIEENANLDDFPSL
ncbi:unnamed protein product [Zymoseptoria tritici ST99CH_1A5]|uniref:F-box domain-containing protein n=3 Tax=Zymoseptoria tritici TaxID=1047171 RepID=A0A1X7S9D5_ZYMT9|nr:unnamed protein product [Zymoseptoria tritici ST99CH_3D7]SMR61015.1 unnamed protein product [Zymoseptoria tritici ST99CH_1E4]SMY29507.1 unnamed protein product [Zymoseptoria tritici ST99CH_1A5]